MSLAWFHAHTREQLARALRVSPNATCILQRLASVCASTRTRGRYEYSDAALMSFSSLLSADVRASNREVRFFG